MPGERGELEKTVAHLQIDQACDLRCDRCDRYFQCNKPEKKTIIETERLKRARQAMAKIKHKIAVSAGKGGVGKSMTTCALAIGLALKGRKVGVLDHDFDGPCDHRMLGVVGKELRMTEEGIIPVEGPLGIKIVSLGNVLKEEEVLIWFHKMRRQATEEFLCHVAWGELDYLLVDLPPGTSSDAVDIMQYIPDLDGMITVTIPAKVSQVVAKKATKLAQMAQIRVLGVIENMSGYGCPQCGRIWEIFEKGGGELLAKECGVPLLGKIPMDPRVSSSNDRGAAFLLDYPDSPATKAVLEIVDKIIEMVEGGKS